MGAGPRACRRPVAIAGKIARYCQKAVRASLVFGTIAGAALDVFWHEPPGSPEMAPSPEFFKMDNVILAPHNGGATWDARSELTKATARQIVALIAGERPPGLVQD